MSKIADLSAPWGHWKSRQHLHILVLRKKQDLKCFSFYSMGVKYHREDNGPKKSQGVQNFK